jgi:peptidoglycan glycosyltransferase
MTRQIRLLGIALMVLFLVLFLQLNYLQVVHADKLAHDPRNTRQIVRDFSRARGDIQTSDGVVLARSVKSDDGFKRQRQYPTGALFGHITGYISFQQGATGVEDTYRSELSGRGLGTRLPTGARLFSNETITGTVTLSLSAKLQQVAADALGKRKGTVVALDPTTGAVLALYSYPSYDPTPLAGHDAQAVQDAYNALNKDPNQPLLAKGWRRAFAPGSTFKVVTASAALDHKPELAQHRVVLGRQLALPTSTKSLPNFGGEACGGTLPNLLKVSCNTGFGQMGLDLGADNLTAEADAFGVNKKPPFDESFPAESSQFPKVSAFKGDLPRLALSAIGQQDVAATPLEMALIASAIANGGVIMKPHVMQEIRDSEGRHVRNYKPEQWLRATSPETAAAVRDMMIGVVTGGTATRAAIPGIQVAGKTGTAQTSGNNVHAWLIAFAPADAPKVAVAVIVEDQPGLSEATGGRIAAPIAQTVMKSALGMGP